LLVLAAIIAWKMVPAMAFDVQHPVVFAVFSLSMMACCVAPPLYAVGDISAPRIRSTMWMQFVVMLVLTIVYFARWIWQVVSAEAAVNNEESEPHFSMVSSVLIVVLALFLCFGSLLSVVANKHYYSGTSAIIDMVSGDARKYLDEKMERLEVLQDDSVREVVFSPHSVRPELLFQSDIYTDPTLWENEIVATYYGKDSVRVE
jgi:hypothetical protein